MNKRRSTLLLLAATLILACTCPAIAATGANPPATATPAGGLPSTSSPSESPATSPAISATATLATATACFPQLSANSAVNVRKGPGTVYDPPIGALVTGQTAAIDGKNSEGTWWYIIFPSGPGGHGWVAASVTTATCITGPVAIIVPPPTPIPPTEVVVRVTGLSVTVSPKEIHVAGCMGPIQPSTASATITVNGPIKLKWHFVTQQNGTRPTHNLNFSEAGSKSVSESFTPHLTAGDYWVRLVIQDMDIGGMDFQARYKIFC